MKELPADIPHCALTGTPSDTRLHADRRGTISIEGLLEAWEVGPSGIETLRPDLFREGRFSALDALVHACGEHGIAIRHHFDEQLRTHVIDSLDARGGWWYAACYHGCRRCEEPAHRMDTYPWRDWTRLEVYRVPEERIGELHAAFRAEVERLESGNGNVVVPEVSVRAPLLDLSFSDVAVRPHGLRDDVFQPDVVTAADAMLSLAEQGEISLDLTWVECVGETLVQSYHFTRFNEQEADGLAGFTYELGEKSLAKERPGRFGNNHFHIMSDIRILVCPEYVHWRWTDLSGRH